MTKSPDLTVARATDQVPGTSFFPWLRWAAGTVMLWAARSRQRRHLADLDETALRDIGLTRRDVQREIAKPFWRD